MKVETILFIVAAAFAAGVINEILAARALRRLRSLKPTETETRERRSPVATTGGR